MTKTLQYLLLCCLILSNTGYAQVFKRVVDVHVYQVSPAEYLEELSSLGSFDYSYNPKVLNDTSISLSREQITVQEALEIGFESMDVVFKQHNNTIILKAIGSAKRKSNATVHTIRGTVLDKTNRTPINNAVVYEPRLQLLAITDERGQFSMEVKNPDLVLFLTAEKSGFTSSEIRLRVKDSKSVFLSLTPHGKQEVNLRMEPISWDESPVLASTQGIQLLSSPDLSEINKTNVVPLAFGVIPQWSNTPDSYKSDIQNAAFYLGWNQAAGLDGFSGSLIANSFTYNANYVVFAGIGNHIGGTMNGLSFAGIFNSNRLKVDGVQFSGIVNYAGLGFSGVQFAGLYNQSNGKMEGAQVAGIANTLVNDGRGVQLAGIVNIGGNAFFEGAQIAGITNLHKGSIYGLQVAGISNQMYGPMEGLQLSAISNQASSMNGAQLSAISNKVDTLEGVQVAAIINKAGVVKGAQIGLLNFADTISFGASIGFFSFVKNGYRQWRLGYQSTDLLSFQFASGSKPFYNIFSAKLSADGKIYGLGYGFGSQIRVFNFAALNIELLASQLSETPNATSTPVHFKTLNVLTQAKGGINFYITKHIGINTSFNFNTYFTQYLDVIGSPIIDINGTKANEVRESSILIQNWPGYSFSIFFQP